MKYWSGSDILEKDILEGESIFDVTNPHPAYSGSKEIPGRSDTLYEVEIIPSTAHTENIIDPVTFNTEMGLVCSVLYRTWKEDDTAWREMVITLPLKVWGFSAIPYHKQNAATTAFNAAMAGI